MLYSLDLRLHKHGSNRILAPDVFAGVLAKPVVHALAAAIAHSKTLAALCKHNLVVAARASQDGKPARPKTESIVQTAVQS